jgi:hypothetical protein
VWPQERFCQGATDRAATPASALVRGSFRPYDTAADIQARLDKEGSQVKGQWLLTAALFMATATAASADAAAHRAKIMETKDLLGFWAFEDNLTDASPNKNDARPGGNAAQVTFGPGANGGRAIVIDNRNDEHNFVDVNTPIGSIFDTPNMTIIFWARNDKIRPDPDVTNDQWNGLVDRSQLWYTSLHSVPETNPAVSQLVVRLYGTYHDLGATPQIGKDVQAENPQEFHLRQGEWHQMAMTYDGKQVISYVDGKQMVAYDHEGTLGPVEGFDPDAQPQWNLTWGLWQQRGDDFTGAFDDTAYFSRALTPEEIKGLYDAMQQKTVEPPPTAGS